MTKKNRSWIVFLRENSTYSSVEIVVKFFNTSSIVYWSTRCHLHSARKESFNASCVASVSIPCDIIIRCFCGSQKSHMWLFSRGFPSWEKIPQWGERMGSGARGNSSTSWCGPQTIAWWCLSAEIWCCLIVQLRKLIPHKSVMGNGKGFLTITQIATLDELGAIESVYVWMLTANV